MPTIYPDACYAWFNILLKRESAELAGLLKKGFVPLGGPVAYEDKLIQAVWNQGSGRPK